jgi:peptide/nickel transport system permease protein
MKIFGRWSALALLILLSAAVFSPAITPDPLKETGAPYSRPLWADRTIPPSSEYSLGTTVRSLAFDWTFAPPSNIVVEGTGLSATASPWVVTLRAPDGRKSVLASSATLPKADRFLLDGRDLSFKRALGMPPLANIPRVLFATHGRYELAASGDLPSDASVAVRLAGGRSGILGTDGRGRDVWAVFVAGIRISLVIGIAATLVASLLGLAAGLAAGYLGGATDQILMRLVDILLSIPTLPILMVLASVWGKGLWQLVLILSIFSWMGTARTIRSMTMTLRDAPFVEGLRGIGARPWYIIARHLAPEALPLLLATVALGVPGAVLAEAGLSFLGLSDPRILSWGRMLHEAHAGGAFTAGAWWVLLPPGLGISLLCLIFLDIGRTLEEIVDPRLRPGDGARSSATEGESRA